MSMPKVHYFDHSGHAYDMSQCSDDIKDGDVLVVNGAERSVAILMGAWPICCVPGFVTDVDTRFDCPKPGYTVEDVVAEYCGQSYVDTPAVFYTESITMAEAELKKLGSPLSAEYPLREGA